MSIKENVDYIKEELSSQEKFLENFVKGERFYKKYKTLIFAFIAIVILGGIGLVIKNNIDESNKLKANIAFNKVLENSTDTQALEELKNTNEKLYEVALFLQAKKENKAVEVNIPLLKELLDEANNQVIEIQRNELANYFKCAPSQINYVLDEFSEEEQLKLPERIETSCDIISDFCLAGINYTMNQYNNK